MDYLNVIYQLGWAFRAYILGLCAITFVFWVLWAIIGLAGG